MNPTPTDRRTTEEIARVISDRFGVGLDGAEGNSLCVAIKEALDAERAAFTPYSNFEEYQKAWEVLDNERKAALAEKDAEIQSRYMQNVDLSFKIEELQASLSLAASALKLTEISHKQAENSYHKEGGCTDLCKIVESCLSDESIQKEIKVSAAKKQVIEAAIEFDKSTALVNQTADDDPGEHRIFSTVSEERAEKLFETLKDLEGLRK